MVLSVTATQSSRHDDSNLPDALEGVDIETGLQRVLGNKSWYLSLLRKFVELHADTAGEIRQALAAGDRETAFRLAHTIKGVTDNIGAAAVHVAAAVLEKFLGSPTADAAVFSALDSFEKSLVSLVTELRAKVPPETLQQMVVLDLQALVPLCEKLACLLREDDSEAVSLLEANEAAFKAAFTSEYQGLRALITEYSFEKAYALLVDAVATAGLRVGRVSAQHTVA